MKKSTIILIILIIIISIIVISITPFLNLIPLTGKAAESVDKTRTYTKAICNESNFCQDNIIACDGNKTISITPITGAVVQHPENWEDPRDEKTKEKLC